MLGPPIKDPVAFRLTGPDRNVFGTRAQEMIRVFKQTPGTVRPYSNWGAPAHQVEIAIDPVAENDTGEKGGPERFGPYFCWRPVRQSASQLAGSGNS